MSALIRNPFARLGTASGAKLVLWILEAIGAVARPISEKASDTINVRDFGAVLDGETDDTAAVQKAINHAGAPLHLFDGEKPTVVVEFVPGTVCKIAGTLYLPSFVVLDLKGCILKGTGQNTIFESGMWQNGQVVSNTEQADEATFVVCSSVRNGGITNADRAFNLQNFCERSEIRQLRCVGVNQVIYGRHCFYASFTDIHARSPLVPGKYPAYHLDGEVNAVRMDSLFAVGYDTQYRFSGNKDNLYMINCGAEQGGVGIDVHGPTYAMSILGWYFEDLVTAVNFADDGNHENVAVDGCWFHSVTNAVGGSNLTGTWGAHNKLQEAKLNLPANFFNRVKVAIPTDSTPKNALPQLPANYVLGDTCETDYVKAIYDDQTGLVAVKGEVHVGVIPRVFAGDVGAPVAGNIPFCTSVLTADSLTVDTKIRYREGAWVAVSLTIQATGLQEISALINRGRAVVLQKSAVVFAVSNNNGYFRLSVTGMTAATTFSGEVQLLK